MSNKQPEVLDARERQHITAEGSTLRTLIKQRISNLLEAHKALMIRMNNEMVDKEEATTLMVALNRNNNLNERALFIKACVERAAYLEGEIDDLNTLGQTFAAGQVYRISLSDAQRFGI